MHPKVYIIILNWNGLEDTLECLESVFELSYPKFEVLVVDNGSTDDSVAVIRKAYRGVILIENKENLGYTGGNNIGMRYALNNGADYVWLLNNDTVVEIDTLSKLVDRGESSPEIGLISPIIYYYDEPHKIQSLGSYVDWKSFEFFTIKSREQLSNEIVRKDMFLWGTALLIKRSVIDSVGYLSEKYFAYQEDAEYSIRAAKSGYRNVIENRARVYHKNSRSTGSQTSLIQVFLRVRNSYFFWMGNLKGFRKLSYFWKFMADTISRAAALKNENFVESVEACFNGAWAGFLGIGGSWDKNIIMPSLLKKIFHVLCSWHPYFWASLLRGEFRSITSEVLKRTKYKILRVTN